MAVTMTNVVFWVVKPCGSCKNPENYKLLGNYPLVSVGICFKIVNFEWEL
jgi:hypothetical protein